MLKSVFLLILAFAAAPAEAFDCSDLKPVPPKNESTSFTGKLDASVDSFFAKLASAGAKVDGTYSKVATNVLAEIPNADRIYMWERVLFLNCQLLAEANDISNEKKLQMVADLYAKFGSAPPPLTSEHSGSSITNSGNNSQIIQGDGNSVINNK
jgi:hypothetical protein